MRPRIGPLPELPKRTPLQAVAELLPFGLGVRHKPRHFLEMTRAFVENRDNIAYAWRILRSGVCDGCSLGPNGLKDDVIEGVHLCTTRLNLLRWNTMGPMDPDAIGDVESLRAMDNGQLRSLGRLSTPLVRFRGEKGFRAIPWDDALELAAKHARKTDPKRMGWFATSRGIPNEVYYVFQKVARILGSPHIDTSARLCERPSSY